MAQLEDLAATTHTLVKDLRVHPRQRLTIVRKYLRRLAKAHEASTNGNGRCAGQQVCISPGERGIDWLRNACGNE